MKNSYTLTFEFPFFRKISKLFPKKVSKYHHKEFRLKYEEYCRENEIHKGKLENWASWNKKSIFSLFLLIIIVWSTSFSSANTHSVDWHQSKCAKWIFSSQTTNSNVSWRTSMLLTLSVFCLLLISKHQICVFSVDVSFSRRLEEGGWNLRRRRKTHGGMFTVN